MSDIKEFQSIQKLLKEQSIRKKLCIWNFLFFLDFDEQLKFNKNFEEKLISLYRKKIQRYEIFEKEESLEKKKIVQILQYMKWKKFQKKMQTL